MGISTPGDSIWCQWHSALQPPQIRFAGAGIIHLSIWSYPVCSYPLALEMIASGLVDAKRLITHHFPLEKTLDAFETSRTGAGGAIKVMIHCDQ